MYKCLSKDGYIDCETIEEAKTIYKNIFDKYLTETTKPKEYKASSNQPWDSDKEIAELFYENFFGFKCISNLEHTNFELESESIIARCFFFDNGTNHNLIKVSNGVVTEVYQKYPFGHERYSFTYNLQTKELVYYYKLVQENSKVIAIKYDIATDLPLSETYLSEELPEKYNSVYSKYPEIFNFVFRHGTRPYGYMVEYNEQPLLEINENYNTELENLINEIRAKIIVIKEGISNETYLYETETIDTSDW
jgi:hypothetical protein